MKGSGVLPAPFIFRNPFRLPQVEGAGAYPAKVFFAKPAKLKV